MIRRAFFRICNRRDQTHGPRLRPVAVRRLVDSLIRRGNRVVVLLHRLSPIPNGSRIGLHARCVAKAPHFHTAVRLPARTRRHHSEPCRRRVQLPQLNGSDQNGEKSVHATLVEEAVTHVVPVPALGFRPEVSAIDVRLPFHIAFARNAVPSFHEVGIVC
jgi:hypothetical protein